MERETIDEVRTSDILKITGSVHDRGTAKLEIEKLIVETDEEDDSSWSYDEWCDIKGSVHESGDVTVTIDEVVVKEPNENTK